MAEASKYAWKDPTTLTRVVQVLGIVVLFTWAASLTLSLVVGQASEYAADQVEFTGPQLIRAALDTANILFLLAVIPYAMWIWRVTANAHTFGRKVDAKPGWTIAWHVIPIAFLFMPYSALSEVWDVSNASKRLKWVLLVWWVGFIARSLTLNIYNFAAPSFAAGDPGSPLILAAFADLCGVVSGLAFIPMLGMMAKAQKEAHVASAFSDAQPEMIMMGDEPPVMRPAE